MKYYISWSEKDFDLKGFSSRSLIKTFLEVYGVRDFVIYSKKLCVVGSNWIRDSDDSTYDIDFYFMIRAFLPEKQVIKFTRLLVKNRLDFYRDQVKKCKSYDDIRLSITREDKSYNDMIKEVFNA